MKKKALSPLLLMACSLLSAIIYRSPFAYFNLGLSAVIFYIVVLSKSESAANRTELSAIWLLLLELIAFLLLLFGVNLYQPPIVWAMYAAFAAAEIFISPRIHKER